MATAKYDFYVPHERVQVSNLELNPLTGELVDVPSRTKQSFRDECDINNILKQYKATGQIRHISARAAQGTYEDLPSAPDFQESMNIIIAAEASFATLPSRVRERFANDPAQFLGFMADPANKDEIVRMGLTKPIPPPEAPPPTSQPQNRSDGQKNDPAS